MAQKTLVIDLDRCIGCHACEVACKQENGVPLGVYYNKVLSIGPLGKFPDIKQYFLPSVCQVCKDAPCLKVCPTGATYRTEDGQILVNKEKCIGCKMCLAACPYGAPQFNDKGETSYWPGKTPLAERPLEPWQKHVAGKAEHCTLCSHRLAQGLKPACVENCSTGALTLVDYENPAPEVAKRLGAARMMKAEKGTNPKIRYIGSHFDISKC